MESKQVQTMTFGSDSVTYLGMNRPTGMIACKAMKLEEKTLAAILPLCQRIAPANTLIKTCTAQKSILLAAGKAAHELFDILGSYDIFSYMADPAAHDRLDEMYTLQSCKRIFPFCGRQAGRIKALYYDGTGYVLPYKHLTEKRFLNIDQSTG